ncbi:MAG: hypothetical protein ABIW17_02110 [Marmoricola sp.]
MTIVADVVDLCRVAAARMSPDELSRDVTGDVPLADLVLATWRPGPGTEADASLMSDSVVAPGTVSSGWRREGHTEAGNGEF